MASRRKAERASPVEEDADFVSVTITAAAAGNYSAGDVLSASASAGAGVATAVELSETYAVKQIAQVVAVCSEDSVVFRLRLHFYDYNPAAADVEMDDNEAVDFAKNATGAAGYIGSVTLSAFRDGGTSMAVSETELIDKLLRVASGLSKVYMVVEVLDAEANETAAMTVRFDIYFR